MILVRTIYLSLCLLSIISCSKGTRSFRTPSTDTLSGQSECQKKLTQDDKDFLYQIKLFNTDSIQNLDKREDAYQNFQDAKLDPKSCDFLKVDTIFEVSFTERTLKSIENRITMNDPTYFSLSEKQETKEGYSESYESKDHLWKKTIHYNSYTVNWETGNRKPITPYRIVFYEDTLGGVIRIKPDGYPIHPDLPHMVRPHWSIYFKLDKDMGLRYKNEAFKIIGDSYTAVPSHPFDVQLSQDNDIKSKNKLIHDQSEAELRKLWSFKTHVRIK